VHCLDTPIRSVRSSIVIDERVRCMRVRDCPLEHERTSCVGCMAMSRLYSSILSCNRPIDMSAVPLHTRAYVSFGSIVIISS